MTLILKVQLQDAFIAKVNLMVFHNGEIIWLDYHMMMRNSITIDENDNLYIAGYQENPQEIWFVVNHLGVEIQIFFGKLSPDYDNDEIPDSMDLDDD